MNALRDADITDDQRLLLLFLGDSWHENGQWPVWGYVQHYFDTKRRTDAEALLRTLPRIGNHTPFGAGYGYTTAVTDHRPIDETDTIRLTLAACYALPEMVGWAGKPFIRVLKHMIDLWDAKPVTPSDPGNAYLNSKYLAPLDLRPAFVTALPDLLSYEPAISAGNSNTSSANEWRRQITRSVLQYRDANTIHDYLDITCRIVENNAAQYAKLTDSRFRVRGVAESDLYAHPPNTYAHETEPARTALVGPDDTLTPAEPTALHQQLFDRLQALHERACENTICDRAASIPTLVAKATNDTIPHSSDLTEPQLRNWLFGKNFRPPISAKNRGALIAAVAAMSAWAGEEPEIENWRQLIDGAAAEALLREAEQNETMQPKSTLSAPASKIVPRDDQVRGNSTRQEILCWQKGAAVLIGVSEYQELPPVPSIVNNIDSLQEIMTSSMGIPRENVFVVKDPDSSSAVHEAVDQASEAADPAVGALLVYFAGHGWTDARGRLMLGLLRSSKTRTWSAFDFNALRIQIADSQIGKRIVILDSCYSGAALDVLGQPEDLASAAVIDGTYVLTSANASTAALAPAGERFTTFTGHLVNALRNGIPQGPPVINADTLFRYIERIAKARGIPAPGRQIGGDGDRVEIMTNRWGQ
ncbi:caspase family protein [Streptomyces gardneri]|uniref:caspase family protein n=1 Tax=Streptomyces gardneri TaxID=66892 RepID=UPI0035D9B01A